MKKTCSICGRPAAYAVIDKLGFMQPGTICPSHYLGWKARAGANFFIFQIMESGEELIREYLKERQTRSMCEEQLDLHATPQRIVKTMKEIRFDAIIAAYEYNGRNAQAACRELGISKATFYRELNRNHYRMSRVMKEEDPET